MSKARTKCFVMLIGRGQCCDVVCTSLLGVIAILMQWFYYVNSPVQCPLKGTVFRLTIEYYVDLYWSSRLDEIVQSPILTLLPPWWVLAVFLQVEQAFISLPTFCNPFIFFLEVIGFVCIFIRTYLNTSQSRYQHEKVSTVVKQGKTTED